MYVYVSSDNNGQCRKIGKKIETPNKEKIGACFIVSVFFLQQGVSKTEQLRHQVRGNKRIQQIAHKNQHFKNTFRTSIFVSESVIGWLVSGR